MRSKKIKPGIAVGNNLAYKLKLFNVGKNVIIWPQAKIVNPGKIAIGNFVIIDDFVFMMGGQKTEIGNFVHIASFASITGGGKFYIEDFGGISSGVRIFTGNEDYSGASLTNPTVPFPYRKPIRSFVNIKKHAVLGANVVVMPGVTVGEGVVVTPGSVVVADCLSWTIYSGNPARPVKSRPFKKILQLENELKEKFLL